MTEGSNTLRLQCFMTQIHEQPFLSSNKEAVSQHHRRREGLRCTEETRCKNAQDSAMHGVLRLHGNGLVLSLSSLFKTNS